MKRSKSTNILPHIFFQVKNVKNFGVFGQLEEFSPQSWNFPRRETNGRRNFCYFHTTMISADSVHTRSSRTKYLNKIVKLKKMQKEGQDRWSSQILTILPILNIKHYPFSPKSELKFYPISNINYHPFSQNLAPVQNDRLATGHVLAKAKAPPLNGRRSVQN